MIIKKQNITGIVLAGGKSRRMGTEKGLVEFHGRPLIEYALNVMQKMAGRVLISANTPAYDHYGLEVVADYYPDSGPMGGIYSCLSVSKTQDNLVLSCDTPFASEELYHYLLSLSNEYDIVVPWNGNEYYEPLCAYYSKKSLDVLEDFILRKNFRIPDVFEKVNFLPVMLHKNLPFYHEHLCFNINSRSDLQKAFRGKKK